jgi:hypothetical protein
VTVKFDWSAMQRLPHPITDDFGVWKVKLEDGDPVALAPQMIPGSLVKFRYYCFSMPLQLRDPNGQLNPVKEGTAIMDMNRILLDRKLVGHGPKEGVEIELGRGFQVEGMELGLRTMRTGERSLFICQPRYAEVPRLILRYDTFVM